MLGCFDFYSWIEDPIDRSINFVKRYERIPERLSTETFGFNFEMENDLFATSIQDKLH